MCGSFPDQDCLDPPLTQTFTPFLGLDKSKIPPVALKLPRRLCPTSGITYRFQPEFRLIFACQATPL
jgi:hypothetical protein